jgi:hypothetical protein
VPRLQPYPIHSCSSLRESLPRYQIAAEKREAE